MSRACNVCCQDLQSLFSDVCSKVRWALSICIFTTSYVCTWAKSQPHPTCSAVVAERNSDSLSLFLAHVFSFKLMIWVTCFCLWPWNYLRPHKTTVRHIMNLCPQYSWWEKSAFPHFYLWTHRSNWQSSGSWINQWFTKSSISPT